MALNYTVRYTNNPLDFKSYDTQRIRNEFLIEDLFSKDDINMVYTFYDRYVIGGVIPGKKSIKLEVIDPLKAEYFLQRREMGIFNIGGEGVVEVDGEKYSLGYLDALYIGKGKKDVVFNSKDSGKPAVFYFNSALAHTSYPVKKVTPDMAEVANIGTQDMAGKRSLNKMIAGDIVETCQIQMGYTDLEKGNVWNTMPAHLHERRMEAYMYFEVDDDQSVCHFMGQPDETRHIWLKNRQAVISPSWSIHSAAGTSNYKFIWGMAGENKDFTDMDKASHVDMK